MFDGIEALIRRLAAAPDVLILDEPTNHLDSSARRLLVDALSVFRGVGLIVSHDRGVLDELTTTTVRVRGGGVETWSGGYAVARRAWEAAAAHDRARREEAKRRRKAVRQRLAQARRSREAAEAAFGGWQAGTAPARLWVSFSSFSKSDFCGPVPIPALVRSAAA